MKKNPAVNAGRGRGGKAIFRDFSASWETFRLRARGASSEWGRRLSRKIRPPPSRATGAGAVLDRRPLP
ncbi:hypothetical protein F8B43_4311 [Methylorubrum populi]|uniref:Uncharacterized protein n=1 Tax=Methylorubrum populi TaxID=223967 RepID=A0A833J3L1_9HYPH|nr:hypothetical protein F8B43_4311 [Methylorubrum populi]